MRNYYDPVVVNFGCLPQIPDGWCVMWHPSVEHYIGHGPDEWESPICWNRFWVRQWVIDAAKALKETVRVRACTSA